MGTGGTTRAWESCPTCIGWDVSDHRWKNTGAVYENGHTKDCPTCAAHFKAVDEARAQGAAEATERAAKVVGQEVQKWYDWAEEARGDEDMELRMTGGYDACVGVAAAIRAAGDTVKGGTSDGK